MRFPFRQIPYGSSPRPLLDVVVEGLELAPQTCLIDSGATAVRMGTYVAELIGLDLGEAPRTRLAVGGALIECRMAEVTLAVGDGGTAHRWDAPVWFCEPWRPAFGLLGLTGFLDRFVVTLAAYEEWFELRLAGQEEHHAA